MRLGLSGRTVIGAGMAFGAAWLGLVTATALAAPSVQAASSEEPTPAPVKDAGPLGFLDGIERSNFLFGDMWGLRPVLGRAGITLTLQETSEVLGNVGGGTKRGVDYDGLTQLVLQMDTSRALALQGGTFNVSALQLHGRNLSAANLASLQTASGIEGDRGTRLWELWYQQKFLDEDRLDIKLGQQSLDQEFIVSQNALSFVNTMFGWPMLPSADLPGGGPAYPLSALGVRARAKVTDSTTVLAGVFNGSPAASNIGDPQLVNPSGTSFPLNGGVLAIAEIQYAYPSQGTLVSADEGEPLSRAYKLGFYYDTERFSDQRLDTAGRSLADPLSNGAPRSHAGNLGFYAVADQMIWRSFNEPDQNVNFFIRAMGTPQEDRNLISFSLNAGLLMHEPLPRRDDDTFGIGMGLAHVSGRASALDRDTGAFTGTAHPVRGDEIFLEATYQYQVAPWFQLQPDIQHVFRPGGGLPDPNNPARRIGDETVIGLRTNIQF